MTEKDISEVFQVLVEDRVFDSETRLWRAVVANAFDDAFNSSDRFLTFGDSKVDPDIERGEARRFLTSDLEPWRSDRIEVCSMAELDPDAIQDAARRLLEARREADTKMAIRVAEAAQKRLDGLLMALVAKEKDLTEKQITRQLERIVAVENRLIG